MSKKPNLIYIFADQWRKQAVGFMKEDSVITPNIDAFSKESMVFNNAISVFPLCSPHRASLMTGKYPLSTGMFTNCKTGCDVMLKEEEICIGDVLKENGYNTGYIGKLHLDLPEVNVTENPISGAKDWDAYTPPGPKRHGFDFWYSYGTFDVHMSPHYWKDTPEMININKWSVEHETDIAIDYIKNHSNADKPFALFLSWNPPHSPYDQVPEKYKKMYEDMELKFRPNVKVEPLSAHTGESMEGGEDIVTEKIKNYFAAVTGLDENFKRILDILKEQNLVENTIVVLSSDHGDMLASQGLMAKHVWFEESIGIPCIMRWPNKIKNIQNYTLFGSADIMPTLLGLMDLPIPNTVEGLDISQSILRGEKEEIKSLFICATPGREVFLKEFKAAGKDPRAFGWRGVRTERYTYVIHKGYSPQNGQVERLLYDNKEDPYQLHPTIINNIEENNIAKELEKEVWEWVNKLKDPFVI